MVLFTLSTRRTGALLLASAANLLFSLSTVDAHGYLTSPLAEFTDGAMPTKYCTTMDPAFEGKFNDNPQANVDTFTKAFKAQQASGYKDLRSLLADKGSDCGDSKQYTSAKPIPADGKVVWQNPDTGEGFVASHTGPCEIWLDDQRVFSDDNCAGHFPSKPKAEMPVDFSKCTGDKCLLRFYWLALHEPKWQVYKNCVPLIGNGGPRVGSEGDNSKIKAVGKAYSSFAAASPAMAPSPTLSPSSESPSSSSPSPSESSSSPTPTPSAGEYAQLTQSTPEPTQQQEHKCDKIRPNARKQRV